MRGETETVEVQVLPAPELGPGEVVEPTPAPFGTLPRRRGRRETNRGSLKRRFARDVFRGLVFVSILHLFVIQVSVVRGHSMKPSLFDGDRLVVDRISCAIGDVGRFDVVVMNNPRDHEVDYVKRVVALPGERVRLVEGRVYVDGRLLDEDFGPILDRATTASIVVPEGHYWVLGDNRPISCDSRDFGLVEADLVKGKVRVRFWPLDRLAVF